MDHEDHVALIRAGVVGRDAPGRPFRRWLELGAGSGAFTLALADLLGPDVEIDAVDRDPAALRRLEAAMAEGFPAVRLRTIVADFGGPLRATGSYDGLLAANALHFVRDPGSVLGQKIPLLRPSARVIVVEYDADRGNSWVPYPFSYRRWTAIAAAAGLETTREIGRVPSRFLGAIYAAASDVPAAARPPG